MRHSIYFGRAGNETMGAIPSDGVPFVIVGSRLYNCYQTKAVPYKVRRNQLIGTTGNFC